LLGLLSFVALNALVAHLRSDCGLLALLKLRRTCFDDISRAGFPLQFYERGGYAYRQVFDPLAMAIDINSGVALGVVGALIVNRFRKPTLSHRRN
jgi:hypothetical protein